MAAGWLANQLRLKMAWPAYGHPHGGMSMAWRLA